MEVVKDNTAKKSKERPKAPDFSNNFPDVEKIKANLLLKQSWPAILTTDNKIYIEVLKGQFLDKAKWEQLKAQASLPQLMFDDLENFYNRDWSKYV